MLELNQLYWTRHLEYCKFEYIFIVKRPKKTLTCSRMLKSNTPYWIGPLEYANLTYNSESANLKILT